MEILSSGDQYHDLWLLIAFTRDAILNARQIELGLYNTTSRRAGILFFIQTLGNPTPAEISRHIFRKASSVSELLGRMERNGLIKKVKDPTRQNRIRVMLTEKGHEVYHQSTKRESIRRIMSSLSDEEIQQLMSYLMRIRNRALEELR